MPNLKHFRSRIASVKSTRKITSAMKMVAASKLRQSQEQQEEGKPYSMDIQLTVGRIMKEIKTEEKTHLFPLINEMDDSNVHLLIVVSSDRGLCGGFNGNLVREAKQVIRTLLQESKDVQIVCIGRKGRDLLKREYGNLIVQTYEDVGTSKISFETAREISDMVIERFNNKSIYKCSVLYNRFVNALTQEPKLKQVVPCVIDAESHEWEQKHPESNIKVSPESYRFFPDIVTLFAMLLPQYVASTVYSTLLDSAAGEHSARMNAMDNATKNAGEMIDKLTIRYNRARQANITGELIEIISAMEAM